MSTAEQDQGTSTAEQDYQGTSQPDQHQDADAGMLPSTEYSAAGAAAAWRGWARGAGQKGERTETETETETVNETETEGH